MKINRVKEQGFGFLIFWIEAMGMTQIFASLAVFNLPYWEKRLGESLSQTLDALRWTNEVFPPLRRLLLQEPCGKQNII